MKKYIKYIFILIILATLFGRAVQVRADTTPQPAATSSYTLLEPLPNPDTGTTPPTIDTTGGLGSYLNPMIKIFIGLCAVLSVIMIVVGGLEYMTSELSHTKEAGKERIIHAILGLLIAIGAWVLLNTINPDLLISDIKPSPVSVTTPAGTQSAAPAPTIYTSPQLGTCDYYLNNNNTGRTTSLTTQGDCYKIPHVIGWTANPS